MKYPNLFKSRYPILSGRDWINRIDAQDKQAFIELGLSETNFGKSGGDATVRIYGKRHMSRIGRIGAVVTNSWKFWNKAIETELLRLAEEEAAQNH